MRDGDSIGRDSLATDTDTFADWSYSGGIDAVSPSPSERNIASYDAPMINEVLFNPDPDSENIQRRRRFIEIYRNDTSRSLKGCSLVNDAETVRINFYSKKYSSVGDEYFVVKERSTLPTDSKLKNGILWVKSLPLQEVDGVALVCRGTMVSYVGWGKNGKGPDGRLHHAAVATRMWKRTEDYVDTDSRNVEGYIAVAIQKGESLGRDAFSNNTRDSSDWSYPGGLNAQNPSPSLRNLDGRVSSHALNEVMFKPNDSLTSDIKKGRYFAEIFRKDPADSLVGCSLVKDDGATLVTFDGSNIVDHSYFTVIQDANLNSEYELQATEGILWVKDFVLEDAYGLALVCNNVITDYVAWNAPRKEPESALRKAAVATGMWTAMNDIVKISRGYFDGTSIGRDGYASDTNSPLDWTPFGGLHARESTPAATNRQYTSLPRINEVLFLPDPESPVPDERYVFVEIYRGDTSYRLKDCSMKNNDESFFVENFDNFIGLKTLPKYPYLVLRHNATLDGPGYFNKKEATIWKKHQMKLNPDLDSLALYCDGIMIDYVAWSSSDEGFDEPSNALQFTAYQNRNWKKPNEYVRTTLVEKGESIGRDKGSTDTNEELDWFFPGGMDAMGVTLAARNEFVEPPPT